MLDGLHLGVEVLLQIGTLGHHPVPGVEVVLTFVKAIETKISIDITFKLPNEQAIQFCTSSWGDAGKMVTLCC